MGYWTMLDRISKEKPFANSAQPFPIKALSRFALTHGRLVPCQTILFLFVGKWRPLLRKNPIKGVQLKQIGSIQRALKGQKIKTRKQEKKIQALLTSNPI